MDTAQWWGELAALLIVMQTPTVALLALMLYRLTRMYRLQSGQIRSIRPGQRQCVLRLLLESGFFTTPEQRQLLLPDLPPMLVASFNLEGPTNVALAEIVNRTALWSAKAFGQLMTNAEFSLDGAVVAQTLHRLRLEMQL